MLFAHNENGTSTPSLNLRFWIPLGLLTVSALGLRPGLDQLAKRYTKLPAELRKPLQEFDITHLPMVSPEWKVVPAPEYLGGIGTQDVALIKLQPVESKRIPSYLTLFITYYNQPGDKVPHTPDVCARQGGAILSKQERIQLHLPDSLSAQSPIPVNLLRLHETHFDSIVLFLFSVEGQFKAGRNQVRWALAKPGNRLTYFSKIEVVASFPPGDDNPQTEQMALEACCQLLREALVLLLQEHFPRGDDSGPS